MKVRMEEVLVIIIIGFKSALFVSIDAEMLSMLHWSFILLVTASTLFFTTQLIKGVLSLLYVRYLPTTKVNII